MEITLNGQTRAVPETATVADLLQTLELAGRRVAVEINQDILPRGQYASRQLQPGDRVEIVHAIGGG
jgi:sulfur carrier protein